MPTTLQDAANLALVGLGLVLLSCLLLVGLIQILVALTTRAPTPAARPTAADRAAAHVTRERATAAGVAVALALSTYRSDTVPPVSTRPQTSPWQEVMRAAQLRARSRRP